MEQKEKNYPCSNNIRCVFLFTQHYGLSSALSLLSELILHSKPGNRVGGGNPGDDEAAGGNFSHWLWDINHGWRLGCLALWCSHCSRNRDRKWEGRSLVKYEIRDERSMTEKGYGVFNSASFEHLNICQRLTRSIVGGKLKAGDLLASKTKEAY